MSHKTSFSQNNVYIQCPKFWHWSYVEKLEPVAKGASMFFGSAVDESIMVLLKRKSNYLETFFERWSKSYAFGVSIDIFDNPDIVYSYSDFDKDILTDEDINKLKDWAVELGIGEKDPVKAYGNIIKAKKNRFKSITNEQLKYFNRASWLSLRRKGIILIEAFKNQFVPKIKKIHATQKYAKVTDQATGDTIAGFIDMVLEIEGYNKPIIFDLKTAARPYTNDQIELTDQLTLYAAMKSADYNTDLVGYVVLSKNIAKKTVAYCETCGFLRDGRFKTCNNDKNGVRCNGRWKEKKVPQPEVQVMVETKTPEQIQNALIDIGNIILAMKNQIIYKNTGKCHNWYGNLCPFFKACHKNDLSDLKKKDGGK